MLFNSSGAYRLKAPDYVSVYFVGQGVMAGQYALNQSELIEVGVREGVLGKSKANKVLAVTDWVSAADRIRRLAGLG